MTIRKDMIGSMDVGKMPESYGKPNGLSYVTAALFLIADMAGGGIVALPVAMVRSGAYGGLIIMLLSGITFCYTAHVLSENWIIMCTRWKIYTEHCRKPYPEMAFRAMGTRARSICSYILNIVLFGVAVVYCLLASYIINDFVVSVFGYDVGLCYVLLIVTLAIYPVTLLRSPQDFWWAVVVAMLTTLLSVVLIIVGSLLDYGKCSRISSHTPVTFEGIIVSLGTFMFGFGGHVVFPSVQHDMKHPKQFTRTAVLAFFCIMSMYIPISLIGYLTYGDSLHNSVINSIQTDWIRRFANLFIAIHCILTLTVVVNPLNQEVENFIKAPHHFGWHRIAVRTTVILAILFVAETVPKFGPILNVIGGSTTPLTSAVLPLIYNHYLRASVHDSTKNDYTQPTLLQVFQRNSKCKLLLDYTVIVISLVLGVGTTYRAIIDMASTEFTMPCYLSFLATNLSQHHHQQQQQQDAFCGQIPNSTTTNS